MNENDILMDALGITSDELAAVDPDRAEAELESGGVLPKGMYHAQCVGVQKRDSKSSDAEGWEFEFEVLGGPFRGSHVKDTLWKSDKQSGRNRITIFGKRMGLLTETIGAGDKKQLTLAAGMTGWPDVRGWHGVIEVDVEEYDMTDKETKKPTGKKGRANRLAFAGLHRLDDPKCKDVVKGTPAAIGNDVVRAASVVPSSSASNGATNAATQPAADPYAAAGI